MQRRDIKPVNVPKGKPAVQSGKLNKMPLVKTPTPTFAQKLKRFFMIDLINGLGLTLKFNLGALTDKDSVAGKGIYTEQYPKVRPDVAPRFHGAPRLNMDPETHDTLCIACNLCAIACPEDCIDVIPMDVEIWSQVSRAERKCSTSLSSIRRGACSARLPGSLSDLLFRADAGLRARHVLARRVCVEPRNARAGPRDGEVHKLVLASKKGQKHKNVFCLSG